jgi:hypothetical protein
MTVNALGVETCRRHRVLEHFLHSCAILQCVPVENDSRERLATLHSRWWNVEGGDRVPLSCQSMVEVVHEVRGSWVLLAK